MALGFNNPAVNFGQVDYSGYERGAAAISDGFQQGMSSIIQGVQQRAAERKEKEREKKMRADLAPLVEQMSGGQINIKDVDQSALPLLWERAQQLEKQRAAQAEQGRMVETINGLAQQPVTRESAAAMVAAGVDPKVIGMLAELSKPKEQPWQPTAMDVGGNPMVMTSPNSAQVVRPPEPPPASFEPRVIEQGGVRFYEREPGKFEQVRRSSEDAPNTFAQHNVKLLREDIAKKEQEYLVEQQALRNGDDTTGIWGFREKRSDRMERIALEIAQLRQQLLAAERAGGGASVSEETQSSAPPANRAPGAAIVTKDGFTVREKPAQDDYETRRADFFQRLRQ